MDRKILPLYFPTTVVIVDDDRKFARLFGLRFPDHTRVLDFDDPDDALRTINTAGKPELLPASITARTNDDTTSEHVLLEINNNVNMLVSSDRFDAVSVVLVDYAMPGMNGIEFCRKILNPDIRKILLTGKADDETAVQAFNNNFIDGFYKKTDMDMDSIASDLLSGMQNAFFCEHFRSLQDLLIDTAFPCLRENEFNAFFNRLFASGRWVEYYLYTRPCGILLIGADGDADFLMITSRQDIQTQVDMAVSNDAPDILVEQLQTGRVISWFPGADGNYTRECDDWENYVYTAELSFNSESTYLCALLSPAPGNIFAAEGLKTFAAYRQQRGF